MTNRTADTLSPWKRLLLVVTGLAALAGPVVAGALGGPSPQDQAPQAPALATSTGNPTFEVASVKPNKSGDGRIMTGFQPNGRFTSTNITLGMLIRQAYQLQQFQIIGATVTASRGEKQIVTSTDEQGIYRLADLTDGVWTMRVEMLGFSTATRDITIAPDAPSSTWELKALPFEEITRGLPPPSTETAPRATESAAPARPANASAAPASPLRAFQRAGVNAAPGAPAQANDSRSPGEDANGDIGNGAADGMLINGSVNNGAASPFAQLAAFGNNRRGGRSLYRWKPGICWPS